MNQLAARLTGFDRSHFLRCEPLGPSGDAKSTLLRVISLLELPRVGRVQVGEEVVEQGPSGVIITRPRHERTQRLISTLVAERGCVNALKP